MSGEEAVDLLLWSDFDDVEEEAEDDRRLVQHSCKCSDNEENRRMIKRWIRELMLQNDVVVEIKLWFIMFLLRLFNGGEIDRRVSVRLELWKAFLPRRH